MRIALEVSNFRGFVAPTRAKFELSPGMTAFVGRNNSGKSSLLRMFYELRPVFSLAVGNTQSLLLGNAFGFAYPSEVPDPIALFSTNTPDDITITIEVDHDIPPTALPAGYTSYAFLTGIRIEISREQPRQVRAYPLMDGQRLAGPLMGVGQHFIASASLPGSGFDFRPLTAAFDTLYRTVYIGPFRNVINVGGLQQYYDLAIGDAFIAQWAAAQTGSERMPAEATAKLVSEIETIFDIDRLEVMATPNQKSIQAFVNRQPYNLSELGSGLAQFIAVLYAASTRRPTYILIDEPEANLHPSLQLDFLTTLASYARDGVVFATHSLGLARSGGDRIYSVHKPSITASSQVYEFDDLENIAELVGELSYSGNYDLGYRKLLLVEGPTEIKVFQQILRKLKADHVVTIAHLGGSGTINRGAGRALAELKRFTTNMFAVVDSEKLAPGHPPKDRRDFERVCNRLGIRCHILDRRSTESYFSDPEIKAILGPGFSALQDFDEVPKGWSKPLNWRIAREMGALGPSWATFLATDLGQFLTRLVHAPD